MSSILLLPGNPEYHLTLMTAKPPCPKDKKISNDCVVDRYTQLLRYEDEEGIEEYLEGGECDELESTFDDPNHIEVDLQAFMDGIIIPEPMIEL